MKYLKLFSDENRVRIIKLLYKKPLCVCELTLIMEQSQTNISNHLKKLKENDVIYITKEDKWNVYSINEKIIYSNNDLFKHIIDLKGNVFQKDEKRFEYINNNYTRHNLSICKLESIKFNLKDCEALW